MPRIGIGLGIGRQRFGGGGGFADAYFNRVTADGGTVESLTCVANASALLQQASLLFIPSGYKAGVAYSALPNNGNGDLTWARGSTANRTLSNRTIQSVGINVPRLSYMYGTCPSLLLEPQRTNSLVNSIFDGSGSVPTSWNRPTGTGSSSLTPSTIGSGVQACLQSGTNQGPYLQTQNSIPVSANTTYVFSFYLESLSGGNPNYNDIAWIASVPSGTLTYFNNNVIVNANSPAQVGRISIVLAVSSTGGAVFPRVGLGSTSTSSTGTILFSRPQFEQGAFPTTYIPTTTVTATRLVDTFTRNNIRTNGFIGSTSGTWYVELRNNIQYVRDAATFPLFISSTSTSGASSNSIEFRVASGTSSRLAILKRINGTGTPLFTTTTDIVKVAIKWNSTRLFLWVNGSEITLTGGTETFAVNNFEFLNGFGTDIPLFIQAMALFNTALSDANCQTLTT